MVGSVVGALARWTRGAESSAARERAGESENKMGAPTVVPMTSKEGWAMWPAQNREEDIKATLDLFTSSGLDFHGEITVDGAKYWLFKQPVVR